MESDNIPVVSENLDTMNLSNNLESLKDSMNEPKQTIEVNFENLVEHSYNIISFFSL